MHVILDSLSGAAIALAVTLWLFVPLFFARPPFLPVAARGGGFAAAMALKVAIVAVCLMASAIFLIPVLMALLSRKLDNAIIYLNFGTGVVLALVGWRFWFLLPTRVQVLPDASATPPHETATSFRMPTVLNKRHSAIWLVPVLISLLPFLASILWIYHTTIHIPDTAVWGLWVAWGIAGLTGVGALIHVMTRLDESGNRNVGIQVFILLRIMLRSIWHFVWNLVRPLPLRKIDHLSGRGRHTTAYHIERQKILCPDVFLAIFMSLLWGALSGLLIGLGINHSVVGAFVLILCALLPPFAIARLRYRGYLP